MSHHGAFADVSSFEGTSTNEETINFPRGSYQVTITNDDASDAMQFKFDPAESFMTVYAGESVTVNIQSMIIIITASGASVPYRIWSFT